LCLDLLRCSRESLDKKVATYGPNLATASPPGNFIQHGRLAFRTKDDLIHQTTDALSRRTQQFLADIKSRAVANPVPVLAIATGLAWRLVRHPPISSILIGLGVAALLKSDPTSGPSPVLVRARELANSAPELAGRLADEMRQQSTAARRSATDVLEQFTDSARETGRAALSKAAGVANDISNETLPQTHDACAPGGEAVHRP
jgi:hypothetical protein